MRRDEPGSVSGARRGGVGGRDLVRASNNPPACAERTQEAYLAAARDYVRFHWRSAEEMGQSADREGLSPPSRASSGASGFTRSP